MRLQPWLMPCIGAPAAGDPLRVVLTNAREATSELYSLWRGSFATVLALSESNAKTGGKRQDRTAMGDLTRKGASLLYALRLDVCECACEVQS